MHAKLREVREQIRKLTNDQRALLDLAESENRNLSAEENTTYENRDKRLEELLTRESRLEKQIELDHRRADDPPEDDPALGDDRDSDDDGDDEEKRSAVAMSAVRKFLSGGESALSRMTDDEKRALQADDPEKGGYISAPQQMATGLIKIIDDNLWLRQFAHTEDVAMSASLGAVSLDADPADADWVGEILPAVSEDTSMDFGRRELYPKQTTKLVKISRKLLRVASRPIDQLVRERLGYKFGVTEEKAFLTGPGAGQPLGVFTASNDGISTARDTRFSSATDLDADSLYDIKYSTKSGYWERGRWIFHRDFFKRVRKLKGGDGHYLWTPGIAGGAPATLVDSPYNISEYAPNTFTANQYVCIFGDLEYYWIATAVMLDIQVLMELYAANNQVGYIGRMEVDGMPVLAEAFARGQMAAA